MGELVDRDQEHLRVSQIAFYVLAGSSALGATFALPFLGIAAMVSYLTPESATSPSNAEALRFVRILFPAVALAFLLVIWTISFLTYLAGRGIRDRRRWILGVIVAGFYCLQVPMGTAIGVAIIMVLSRPSVKALFEHPPELPN